MCFVKYVFRVRVILYGFYHLQSSTLGKIINFIYLKVSLHHLRDKENRKL